MTLALASRRTALTPPWVRDDLWRRARAVPSLDLRFADNKSLVDAATGAQLVTFTRASSGTYVGSDGLIMAATTNEARFDHNPTTGESLGLLVEEARTNNLLQSEDFSSTWTLSNIAVTTNSVVAPDGTTTADTIAPPADGLTTTRFLRQNPILTTQQAYTLSVFAKVGTATTNGINLYVSDSTATNIFRANFNLFTLTTTVSNTGWAAPTATIVPYPNGWYRCILTGVTSTVHVSLRAQIYLNIFGNTPDTHGSIHVWGAQLEAGAFPTSCIPTTTATVTRAADVASITGSNFSSWYNQTEGSMYVDGSTAAFTGTVGFVAINNAGNTNRLEIRQGRINPTVTGAGTSVTWTTLSSPTLIANTSYKQAVAFSSASHSNSIAGVLTNISSTEIPAIAATQLIFGVRDSQTAPISGSSSTIKRLVFWPTRLSNEVGQRITQP